MFLRTLRGVGICRDGELRTAPAAALPPGAFQPGAHTTELVSSCAAPVCNHFIRTPPHLPPRCWKRAAVKEPARGFLLCRRKTRCCCEDDRNPSEPVPPRVCTGLGTPPPRLVKEPEEGSCGAEPARHRAGHGSSLRTELPGPGLWLRRGSRASRALAAPVC